MEQSKVHIVLPGRIPSKKNSRIMIFKNRKFPLSIPKPEYKEWERNMGLVLNLKRLETYKKPISLTVVFYLPDKRKTDLINKAESIQDLLVVSKVIADDDVLHIEQLDLRFGGIDVANPRAELFIQELEI